MSCSSRLPPADTQARWQPKNSFYGACQVGNARGEAPRHSQKDLVTVLNSAIDPLTTLKHHATLSESDRRGCSMKHEPINPDSVYSREEAAELLGVSLSTVKRLIAAGQLIASRPESIRRIFIQGSSILQMLEETKIEVER